MKSLLERQLKAARNSETGRLNVEAFVAAVASAYDEIERERRLADRASRLMQEELTEAHETLKRESSKMLDTLFENIREGIVITDTGGQVIGLNLAARTMFRLPPQTGEGLPVVRFLVPAKGNRFRQDGSIEEATGVTSDAQRFPAEISVNEVETGGEARRLWIVRDISKRRAHENTLKAARDAAESANRLKSQFLATMSHELRTPLNAILGFAELMMSQIAVAGGVERFREYASDIHDSGSHLLAIINDILDLSRIESGVYPIAMKILDIGALARDCLGLMQPVADRGGVTLEGALPEESAECLGDERALKQILLNLLSNAVKFTPQGGRVGLELEQRDGRYLLRVSDTGIGIEAKHIPNLFQPFRQVEDSMSRTYGGTGLGLAITKKLIELHGGSVAMESEPGAGTSVTVSLSAQSANNRQEIDRRVASLTAVADKPAFAGTGPSGGRQRA
ncbi:MAG: sensor histidine kinase [Kiloniellales bacterium]